MSKRTQEFTKALEDRNQIPSDVFPSPNIPIPIRKKTNSLSIAQDDSITLHNFRLTHTGLDPSHLASKVEEWDELGIILFRFEGSIQWLIGDWLNGMTRTYGLTYEKIAKTTGNEVRTLHNYASIADRVQFSLRSEILSFGHHAVIAAMNPEDQKYWLDRAEQGDTDPDSGNSKQWSVARLTKEIKRANGEHKTNTETWYITNVRILRARSKQKWNKLSITQRHEIRKEYEDALADFDKWDNS